MMGDHLKDVSADSRIVYLVQPVVTAEGHERRGEMERIGTLDAAHRVARYMTNLGLGVVLWAVVVTGGVVDPSTLTEIGRFQGEVVVALSATMH
jgi:hypothetical protein